MGEQRTIKLFGTQFQVSDDDTIAFSMTITIAQAKRMGAQSEEATSLQKTLRMLFEHGLRAREQELRPEDLRRAHETALDDIETLMEEGVQSLM